MPDCQKKLTDLPHLWLLTDARNDGAMEQAIAGLPARSGIIFRHYHLETTARKARFDAISVAADAAGHVVILSGTALQARQWGASGIYGCAAQMAGTDGLLRLVTVHDRSELYAAHAARADAVLVSPVFATRSHANAVPLGVEGFSELAQDANCPVIALGGMNANRWQLISAGIAHGWAAIDGLLQL